MLVELVQITTRDGVRLDGMYQSAPSPTVAEVPLDVVVFVHGTGSNFYGSTLFDQLGERLLSLGCAVLRVNTRGHDLVSTASTSRGGRRFGAAYETFDDCRHDLTGWIEWARRQVGPRVGLLGHSSGAVKCLYAQAQEPNPAVVALVSLSPPRLSYGWFAQSEKALSFQNTFQQAQALIAAGEPNTLLEVSFPIPILITAAGYVEKYGPEERYNYLRWLKRLACPTLITFGAVELTQNVAFAEAPQAIVEVAPTLPVEIVADGDHYYTGVREPLLGCVEKWLLSL